MLKVVSVLLGAPAALAILCVQALADMKREPVAQIAPVEIGGDAVADACSLGVIIGLDDAAVRTGPGMAPYGEIDRRTNSQKIYVCGERGSWYAVVYDPSGEPKDCGVSTPWPKKRPYRGRCRSGWIDQNSVDILAD